jgi:hypothetical protein
MSTGSNHNEIAALQKQITAVLDSVSAELKQTDAELRALGQRQRELAAEEKRLAAALAAIRAGQQPSVRQKPLAKKAPAKGRHGMQRRRRRQTKLLPAERRTELLLEVLKTKELTRDQLAEEMNLTSARVQQLMKPLIDQKKLVSRPDPEAKRPRMLWRAKGAKLASPA